jgi:hypothetical protein
MLVSAPKYPAQLAEYLASLLPERRLAVDYLFTWSAVRRAQEAGHEAVLQRFADDVSVAWGDENMRRTIVWPINMRVGRV